MKDIIDTLTYQVQKHFDNEEYLDMVKTADTLFLDDPKSYIAAFAIGQYFLINRQFGMALAMFLHCESLKPGTKPVAYNISCCLADQHPNEALKWARKASDYGKELYFAAPMLQALAILNRDKETIELYEKMVDTMGMDPRIGLSAAFSYMRTGNWSEGLKAYATGEGYESRIERCKHLPLYSPKTFRGGVVLIHGDQGIGDEILFSVFISEAIELIGKEVIIEVLPKNKELFEILFGDRAEIYNRDGEEVEDCTHRISFPRLPLALGRTQPSRFEPFMRPLRLRGTRLRGGLASMAGTVHTGDIRRSVPLKELRRLFEEKHPDIEWECVDYKETPLAQTLPWNREIWMGDTLGMVRYMHRNLDFVVAPTTTITDICGAVGVPCYTLVDYYQPNWRFLKGNEWWSCVKSFHQIHPGDWTTPINDLSEALTHIGK